MRNDVDGLVALAVVHTRELGIIRELVEYLDAVYSLRGERVERRRYILAEELLAVNEDFLDLLTLRLHRAVGDGDTWHLLQESLDIGICRDLKCRSVVGHGVAILRCAQRLHLLDYGVDSHSLGHKLHNAEVGIGRELNIEGLRSVANKRDGHGVVSRCESRHGSLTLGTRNRVSASILATRLTHLHNRTNDTLLRVAINDARRHLTRLRHNGNGHEHKGNKCNQSSHKLSCFIYFSLCTLSRHEFNTIYLINVLLEGETAKKGCQSPNTPLLLAVS